MEYDNNCSLVVIVIDVGPRSGFAVAIGSLEVCSNGGAALQEAWEESLEEYGIGNLSGGVVHAPDADTGLGQVIIYLKEVPFVRFFLLNCSRSHAGIGEIRQL
jgi:hypothetical protein